jgi:arabinofuranosyltransferase
VHKSPATTEPDRELPRHYPSPQRFGHSSAAAKTPTVDRTATAWLGTLPYLFLLIGANHVFLKAEIGPFVTFRYAQNLLAGYGPVYNIGERVEGFTSPLHLVLLTLLLAVGHGFGILLKAKLLGVALAILGLWQLRRLARVMGLSPVQSIMAQLLSAMSANYAFAAINAFETSLFICTLLGATTAYVKERDGRSGFWSAVILFLVLLTRPDGAMVFVFFLSLRIYDVRAGRMPWRRAAAWAGIYGGLVLSFVAARWSYYGMLVPNTALAKAVSPGAAFLAGIGYSLAVLSRADSPLVWTLCSAAVFWGLATLGLWRERGRRHVAVIALVVASSLTFVLKYGGGGKSGGWRYMEPAGPFLAILQVWGLSAIASIRLAARRRAPFFAAISAAAMLLFAAKFRIVQGASWSNSEFTTDDAVVLTAGSGTLGEKWMQAADLVRANVRPGSLVMGWDTGYMAYRNPEDRFLDLRGLTDREIASLPKSFKSSIGVSDHRWFVPGDPLHTIWERRRPDYIVVSDAQTTQTLPDYAPLPNMDPASNGTQGDTVRIFARKRTAAP